MAGKIEISPCPFCGSANPTAFKSRIFGGWTMECDGCGVLVAAGENKGQLAAAWNRRAVLTDTHT